MVVLSRLLVVALSALVIVAPPAMADDGSGSPPPPSEGGCGSDGGNCTSNPSGNSTKPGGGNSPPPQGSPGPLENVTVPAGVLRLFDTAPRTPCDLVRPTGGDVKVSVNPVLGLVTVNPGCILRWIRTDTTGIVNP